MKLKFNKKLSIYLFIFLLILLTIFFLVFSNNNSLGGKASLIISPNNNLIGNTNFEVISDNNNLILNQPELNDINCNPCYSQSGFLRNHIKTWAFIFGNYLSNNPDTNQYRQNWFDETGDDLLSWVPNNFDLVFFNGQGDINYQKSVNPNFLFMTGMSPFVTFGSLFPSNNAGSWVRLKAHTYDNDYDFEDNFVHYGEDFNFSIYKGVYSTSGPIRDDEFPYVVFDDGNGKVQILGQEAYGSSTSKIWEDYPLTFNIYFGNDSGNILYLGSDEPFYTITFNVNQASNDWEGLVEYYNGTSWNSVLDLIDGTSNFSQSGTIQFKPSIDWDRFKIQASDSKTLGTSDNLGEYWIRIITTNNPTIHPMLQTTQTMWYGKLQNMPYVGDGVESGTSAIRGDDFIVDDVTYFKFNESNHEDADDYIWQATRYRYSFDEANDDDDDGFISDEEMQTLENPLATGRFRHWGRVIKFSYSHGWQYSLNLNNPITRSFVSNIMLYQTNHESADGIYADGTYDVVGDETPFNVFMVEYTNKSDPQFETDVGLTLEGYRTLVDNKLLSINDMGTYRFVGHTDSHIGESFVALRTTYSHSDVYWDKIISPFNHFDEGELFFWMSVADYLNFDYTNESQKNRDLIFGLASYYLGATNITYFYSGNGFDYLEPWKYFPKAIEFDIGKPINDSPYVFKTGIDPTQGLYPYKVYSRYYDKGLVLVKPLPYKLSAGITYDDLTSTEVNLDKNYRLLNSNGSLEDGVKTKVSLRNGEGAILIDACFDDELNGDEEGVDCGGSCESICENYEGNTYYVSTTGDDNDDGLTPETAWRNINYGVSQMSSSGGDTLYILGGTYYETVMDFVSGTQGNPNTISAYNDEEVIISGGEKLEEFNTLSMNGKTVYTKAVDWVSQERPAQLYINDVRFNLSGYPNEGFLYNDDEGDAPTTFMNSSNLPDRPDDYWVDSEIVFYEGEIWKFRNNQIINDYDNSLKKLNFNSVDKKKYYDFPFRIRHKFEELDYPGEWFVDKNYGRADYFPEPRLDDIYFIPIDNSPIESQDIILSRRTRGISLINKSNLIINGIQIKNVNYYYNGFYGVGVYAENSSFIDFNEMNISLNSYYGSYIKTSNNINFYDSNFVHNGGSGIFYYNVTNSIINNSNFQNNVESYSRSANVEVQYDSNNLTFTNNYAGDSYYESSSGIGIWSGSHDVVLANNTFNNNHGNSVLIEDSRDDSPDHVIKNILVENNTLINAKYGSTGSLWLDNVHNALVRYNKIYGSPGLYGSGIKITSTSLKPGMTDTNGASENITVAYNVLYNHSSGDGWVKGSAITIYAKKDINISHNTFINPNSQAVLITYNSSNLEFKDNLVYGDKSILLNFYFNYTFDNHNLYNDFDFNAYYPDTSFETFGDSSTYTAKRFGSYYWSDYYDFNEYRSLNPNQDEHSFVASNVRFSDIDNLDFRPTIGSDVCGAASDGGDIGALPCTTDGLTYDYFVVNSLEWLFPNISNTNVRTVNVSLAKNERENPQIVVRSDFQNIINNIIISNLTLSSNLSTKIDANNFRIYRAEYYNITGTKDDYLGPNLYSHYGNGSYSDILIPIKDYYDENNVDGEGFAFPYTIADNTQGNIVLEFYIPSDSVAGDYTGSLTINLETGDITIPINLKVFNFTLPNRPSQKSDMHLSGDNMARFYGITSNDPEYFDIRLDFEKMLIGEYKITTGARYFMSFQRYDNGSLFNLEPRLSVLQELYDYGIPQLSMAYTNYCFRSYNLDESLNQSDIVYSTNCAIGLNNIYENLSFDIPFYLLLDDEPNSLEAYNVVREKSDFFSEYSPNYIKMATEQPATQNEDWGSLIGYIDAWTPTFYNSNQEDLQERLDAGEEVWTYTALGRDEVPKWLIDMPLIDYRVPSWINANYNYTGLLYWALIMGDGLITDFGTYERTQYSDWDKSGLFYNFDNGDVKNYHGEGSLFYDPQPINQNTPLPSMRLKAFRDGFEDYEYFEILKNYSQNYYDVGDFINPLFEESLTVAHNFTDYSYNSEDYINLRNGMGELITILMSYEDADNDGYLVSDCDDSNSNINMGATEICDDLDNDCDGFIDEVLDCGSDDSGGNNGGGGGAGGSPPPLPPDEPTPDDDNESDNSSNNNNNNQNNNAGGNNNGDVGDFEVPPTVESPSTVVNNSGNTSVTTTGNDDDSGNFFTTITKGISTTISGLFTSGSSGFIVVIILGVLLVFGVGGVVLYKHFSHPTYGIDFSQSNVDTSSSPQSVVTQTQEITFSNFITSYVSSDKIDIMNYLDNVTSSGLSNEQISSLLQKSGWNSTAIEKAFYDYKLLKYEFGIYKFLESCKSRGLSKHDVTLMLLKNGWNEGQVLEKLNKFWSDE